MTILSENLQRARKKTNLTQQEVANILQNKYKLKSDRVMVSKYETGFHTPSVYIIKCLAEIYNTSMDALNGNTVLTLDPTLYPETIASSTGSIDDLSPTDTPHIQAPTPDPTTTVQLPIYGNVAAGMGAYADNDIIGYEDIPQEWIRGKGDYVLLRVQGDSMYPKFEENDLLLVKCQSVVDNGAYAVVLIDDDSGVVKRVIQGNGWVELQSINPMYVPRRFEGADMERLRIFGLVKKSIRNYE